MAATEYVTLPGHFAERRQVSVDRLLDKTIDGRTELSDLARRLFDEHLAEPTALRYRELRGVVGPAALGYLRRERKPALISPEKSCGCSQAAKCPPRSSWL
jgi:hypothetical protein